MKKSNISTCGVTTMEKTTCITSEEIIGVPSIPLKLPKPTNYGISPGNKRAKTLGALSMYKIRFYTATGHKLFAAIIEATTDEDAILIAAARARKQKVKLTDETVVRVQDLKAACK